MAIAATIKTALSVCGIAVFIAASLGDRAHLHDRAHFGRMVLAGPGGKTNEQRIPQKGHLLRRALYWKIHPGEQIAVGGVVMQRIEFRVGFDKEQRAVSLLVS